MTLLSCNNIILQQMDDCIKRHLWIIYMRFLSLWKETDLDPVIKLGSSPMMGASSI